MPTLRWPDLAPAGRHVLIARAQYAPYRLRDGARWDAARRDALADRVTAAIEAVSPGFRARILLARRLVARAIWKSTSGCAKGAASQGELGLDQILFMRPVAGWGRHRTPIDGLYLGGAGTHPGPGVLGGAGWLAAHTSSCRIGAESRASMATYHPTTQAYQQGARTLPREYYTSEAILAEERERIFARSWNCVGRASDLAEPGDYFVRDIAGESIIVLRDREGTLRALFNICRHRGTRLCREASGRFGETIQCPYHAWTYATDGRLIGAPHMQEVEGFDKADYPLHAAALAEWEGFLFVNIAERPAPFETAWAPCSGRLSRYGLPGLQIGHRVAYDVRANWKLVFQNYSECLHCPTIHPKLATVLPYQSGANDLIEGPFLGGYMEIKAPNESATMSGRACGHLVSDALPGEDRHRAFYYTLMPNLLLEPASRLRELLPGAADRGGSHARGIRVALPSRDAGRSREQHPRRDRVLGSHQPPGLGHRRAEPARHRLAPLRAGAVFAAREHAGGVGPGVFARHGTRVVSRARLRLRSPASLPPRNARSRT